MKISTLTFKKVLALLAVAIVVARCGSSNGGGGTTCSASAPVVTGSNVMSVTVNGSQCTGGSSNYLNEPCVTVTICTPGSTTQCQSINNILLDTGSYGLRIFSSVISVSLPSQTVSTQDVVECAQFGSGNTWGPVQLADVYLGGEGVVSSLPIQVINSNYNSTWLSGGSQSGVPCHSVRDTSPASAGYNGILGVGLFQYDCADCVSSTSPETYFLCSGSTCSVSTVAENLQVQNPVANLASDNNGVILELPTLPPPCAVGGATSINGYLVMGIGTASNNTTSGVTYYPASSSSGNFVVNYGGSNYPGFLDSGSNGLFFPGALATCGSPYSEWFCPSGSSYTGSATNKGDLGTPTGSVPFAIYSATALFNSGNSVFSDLGGSMSGEFDWGLPFFFGRNVYVTIDGKTTTLGTSPGWAY